ELDTSYIRLRAVRVLHAARHPPERPRVGSWPSDVKAGAGRDTRTVVERCGRTSGTARRRLGLRKREAVSARSSICQLPCMEPKKHSRSIGGRRSRFRRHLWRSAGRRGCLTVHSAQSGNGPAFGLGVLTPFGKHHCNVDGPIKLQTPSVATIPVSVAIRGDLPSADPDFGGGVAGSGARTSHTKPVRCPSPAVPNPQHLVP